MAELEQVQIFRDLLSNKKIMVPEYQRAFAWQDKQVKAFIKDLQRCSTKDIVYYYGHFIVEGIDSYEVIDGQQRLTMAVLFLAVCKQQLGAAWKAENDALLANFSTVAYDNEVFQRLITEGIADIESFCSDNRSKFKKEYDSNSYLAKMMDDFFQTKKDRFPTLSSQRMVRAIALISEYLHKEIPKNKVVDFLTKCIEILLSAKVSLHNAGEDKAIAAQIFELSNDRGLAIKTLEKVKAKLMLFVYEHGGKDKQNYITNIQEQFAKVYQMEESIKATNFRGNLSLAHLLLLHLRVVDDNLEYKAGDKDGIKMKSPSLSGDSEEEDILDYIDQRLEKKEEPIAYALNLAKEFAKSVRIVSRLLPEWDKKDSLVGDTLILDRERSLQFFLVIGRVVKEAILGHEELLLWERLLYTWDFHQVLKGIQKRFITDFAELYSCIAKNEPVLTVLQKYVQDGFHNKTKGCLPEFVFHQFFNWEQYTRTSAYKWAHDRKKDELKIQYLLYKYEKHCGTNLAKLREIMKSSTTLEHILPQEWQIEWLDKPERLKKKAREAREAEIEESYLHGIGNLLLLDSVRNKGNDHPKDKKYPDIGGSYTEHNNQGIKWNDSAKWVELIGQRSSAIVNFAYTLWPFAEQYKAHQKDLESFHHLHDKFQKQGYLPSNIVQNEEDLLNYYYDLGLEEVDIEDKHYHIRIHTYWYGLAPRYIQAEYFPNRMAKPRTNAKIQKIDELFYEIIGLSSEFDEWNSWSSEYPITDIEDFFSLMVQCINQLKEAGFQPFPKS